MVKLDYVYVTNWSLWGDVKLLLRTFPAAVQAGCELTIEPKLTTPEQDLGGIARAVLRRWRPALGVLALTLLAAVAVSRFGGSNTRRRRRSCSSSPTR